MDLKLQSFKFYPKLAQESVEDLDPEWVLVKARE
jgi:hypothetical protein